MSTQKNLTSLCVAAVFALGLAACSSGGDAPPTTMPMEPVEPVEPTPVAVSLAGVTAGFMAEAGTVEIKAGMSADHGDIAFGCAAGGEDCTVAVSVADDGTISAMSTGGTVTAMNAAAYQTALDDAEAARIAAEKARIAAENARIAAATKAAATKEKAIMAEAMQTTDAGLGGTLPEGATESTYSMTISRDRMATKIMIADSAMMREADPKFMQAMDLGGGRSMHVRAMAPNDDGETMEEVVIVATDIEEPKATPFAKVAGQMLNARDLDTDVDADGDGTATNDFTALTVMTTDAVLKLVMSAAFPAATAPDASVTHTFQPLAEDGDPNTAGNQPRKAAEVMGTYNGAMGTYRCDTGNNGANCTVAVNAKGELTAISGGWVFTPDEGATSDVPDADYLHYGFWLKKTTDEDGAVTYNEVETFAGSSVAASVGSQIDDVEGMASYEGGAVGVYVRNVYTSGGGSIESRTSGHFTADASLMVYFGGDDIAVNKHNTVTGTIDGFALSGGEANDWSVSLKGTRANSANTITGTTNGGVTDGMFSGMFYGPTAITESTTDSETNRDMPHTVVGEFNASFSNGIVAGGFGARKQ